IKHAGTARSEIERPVRITKSGKELTAVGRQAIAGVIIPETDPAIRSKRVLRRSKTADAIVRGSPEISLLISYETDYTIVRKPVGRCKGFKQPCLRVKYIDTSPIRAEPDQSVFLLEKFIAAFIGDRRGITGPVTVNLKLLCLRIQQYKSSLPIAD